MNKRFQTPLPWILLTFMMVGVSISCELEPPPVEMLSPIGLTAVFLERTNQVGMYDVQLKFWVSQGGKNITDVGYNIYYSFSNDEIAAITEIRNAWSTHISNRNKPDPNDRSINKTYWYTHIVVDEANILKPLPTIKSSGSNLPNQPNLVTYTIPTPLLQMDGNKLTLIDINQPSYFSVTQFSLTDKVESDLAGIVPCILSVQEIEQ